jgi:hypothetical protein
MTWELPPKDHPVWPVVQSMLRCVMVVCLLTLVLHGADGGHTTGVDAEDAMGGAGGALLVRELWQLWRAT